jgi:hypothetical protein
MHTTLASQLSDALRKLVLLSRSGELDAAEAGMTTILGRARDANLRGLCGEVLYRLSYVYDLRGDYYTSALHLDEALEIAERESITTLSAACHFARGRQLMLRGRLQEALDALGQSLMYAKGSGSAARQGDAYVLHGECYLRLGQLRDAYNYVTEAIKLLEDTGSDGLLQTLLAAAAVARQLRLEAEATALLSRAELLAGTAHAQIMSEAYATQALDSLARKDHDASLAQLTRAESLSTEPGEGVQLQVARARQLELRGDFRAAAAEYLAALRTVQQRQSRYDVASVRLERVPGLIALGSLDHAQAILVDCELAFEYFGAAIGLGRTYCGWTQYFLAAGNRIAAATALRQAEATAAKLAPDLGLQFAADLDRARVAAGTEGPADGRWTADTPLPLLHPASTLN